MTSSGGGPRDHRQEMQESAARTEHRRSQVAETVAAAMRFLARHTVGWSVSVEEEPNAYGRVVATAWTILVRPDGSDRVSVSCRWDGSQMASVPTNCVEGVVWADVERLVEDLRARVRSMGGRM